MPGRITKKRIESKAVQGDDSWVEITPIKLGQSKVIARQLDEMRGDPTAFIRANSETITRHVVGWNWVGDDGSPLPLPSEDPSVLDDLTNLEVQFLVRILNGRDE